MVGLGRVVGAGSDLVVLWSPGTTSAAEELVRVLCLQARRVVRDLLTARRDVEAALTARRDVVKTFEAAVRREC